MASADQTRTRDVVDAVVSRAGYDLEDLTVIAAGRRRLLRVVIDSDSGVDLDDAAAVSRDISAELDALVGSDDPMGGAAYTLEVTSPGIGRPLTLPRHFRRARGRLLAITTADGEALTGRVLRAGDSEVELLVGKSGTDRQNLTYTTIAKARVEVEFGPPSAQVLAMLDADVAAKFDQDPISELDPGLDPEIDPVADLGTDEDDADQDDLEDEDEEDHEPDER